MPLPLPVLDDRSYQELIDGMRERLPATAPRWTDHNASDPGITLLELFAYLADSLLYRFDRVPERQQRTFLRLVGCSPRRAQVAKVLVAFGLNGSAPPQELPAGRHITNADGQTVFQTGARLYVSNARITAVLVSSAGRWEDRTSANETLAAAFFPFGSDPRAGDAFYVGFDRPPLGPEHARLCLFVVSEDLAADAHTWIALRDHWWGTRSRMPRGCGTGPCAAPPFWNHYGVRVSWELFSGSEWLTLPQLKDRTRALSMSGPVRWRPAATHAPGGVPGHATTYFIRCRIVDGEFDCPPAIRGVRMNALLAHHAADIGRKVQPARSTGAAAQQFVLAQRPVVPGSVRLTITDKKGVRDSKWVERADFDRSGPHARHFVLDSVAGVISFGNGLSGAVPPANSKLSARWQVGGGSAGNVPAGTLDREPAAGLVVSQPLAAFGGAEAESLDAAKARAYRIVTEERAAATLADFERIALATPAVPLARAYAVAELHPDINCVAAAGCVTIIVVPRCVAGKPRPSAALCRAVARYVEPRRPLAVEVHVVGPRYTTVSVDAALALERTADRAAAFARAKAAVQRFLHPLDGGPDSKGWRAGRAVYRSEVLAVLQAVAGVRHVATLTLTSDEGTPATCGDIAVCATGLVISGKHSFSAA